MRKIREILRLKFEQCLTEELIALASGCSRSTVQTCIRRWRQSGLTWPAAELDATALESRLYGPGRSRSSKIEPDYAEVQRELGRPGVTKLLVWQEFKRLCPDGIQYSLFCERYRQWQKSRDVVLRQHHKPGDKMFVDYAGHTVCVRDPQSGETRAAQIFVCVLGASNYTFAEATWTQSLPDWLGSHVRALEFFGGAPSACVPDNLKSGVTRAHRYEPDINPAYQDFAEHYGLAVLPTRVRRPRDKAKVEAGVLLVERWILARLRHQTFFSLSALNEAISALLIELNAKPFKKMPGSRLSLFESVESQALKPLPERPYEFAAWHKARAGQDYHIEIERRYYSVPSHLAGQSLDVRVTAKGIEVFYRQDLVASHIQAPGMGAVVTHPGHRPAHHKAVIDTTHAKLMAQAQAIGPATLHVVAAQRQLKRHNDEVIRAAQGILRLARDYSPEALERAAEQATALRCTSYRALKTLLAARTTMDPHAACSPVAGTHSNVRGQNYFL